jgi:hypothetical protein
MSSFSAGFSTRFHSAQLASLDELSALQSVRNETSLDDLSAKDQQRLRSLTRDTIVFAAYSSLPPTSWLASFVFSFDPATHFGFQLKFS